MKIQVLIMVLVITFISCKSDERAAETVLEDIERGAFLRTIAISNCEFYLNEPDSLFEIMIQEQDIEEGDLLQEVTVNVQFVDNTTESEDVSTEKIQIDTLFPDDFVPGSFELPVTTLSYTFQELMELTQVPQSAIACKDQFIISLDLVLTNGFIFNEDNSAACILAYNSDFFSPFSYTINVVDAITPETFIGTYLSSSILDGPFGPTFGPPLLVEVENGHSNNVRTVTFDNVPNRTPREYVFAIACDEIIFEKNQIRYNTTNSPCGVDGQPILLGPDMVNPSINPNDDSVFELWFVEGYNGWDGGIGFGSQPSRLRFEKQ